MRYERRLPRATLNGTRLSDARASALLPATSLRSPATRAAKAPVPSILPRRPRAGTGSTPMLQVPGPQQRLWPVPPRLRSQGVHRSLAGARRWGSPHARCPHDRKATSRDRTAWTCGPGTTLPASRTPDRAADERTCRRQQAGCSSTAVSQRVPSAHVPCPCQPQERPNPSSSPQHSGCKQGAKIRILLPPAEPGVFRTENDVGSTVLILRETQYVGGTRNA